MEIKLFKSGEKYNTVIVVHGDIDGLISADTIYKQNIKLAKRDSIAFAIEQPFTVYSLNMDNVEQIYIADIAVDNKNPAKTVEWAKKYQDKVVVWYDHHVGGDMLKTASEVLAKKVVFDITAPSCPALIEKNTPFGTAKPNKKLVDAANACDRPTDYKATVISNRLNSAFKAALMMREENPGVLAEVQAEIIKELITMDSSETVTKYKNLYKEIMKNTKDLMKSAKLVCPIVKGKPSKEGVMYVKLGAEKIDKTQFCLDAYKVAKFVIMQYDGERFIDGKKTDEKMAVTKLSTARKDVDLVKLFGLKSGAPFSIMITEGTHDEQYKAIIEKLEPVYIA